MNAPVMAAEFMIAPLTRVSKDKVQEYFQLQSMYDTLKYRFSDVKDPQWLDVVEVIQRMGSSMYAIMRAHTGQLVGEFTLENPTGKSKQIHFSSNPEIDSGERLRAGKFATQTTLSLKNLETGEYFLDSLYGLTPLQNRAACLYVLRVGYKKQGVLPSGMFYLGQCVDCMISVATRNE